MSDVRSAEYFILSERGRFGIMPDTTGNELIQARKIIAEINAGTYVKELRTVYNHAPLGDSSEERKYYGVLSVYDLLMYLKFFADRPFFDYNKEPGKYNIVDALRQCEADVPFITSSNGREEIVKMKSGCNEVVPEVPEEPKVPEPQKIPGFFWNMSREETPSWEAGSASGTDCDYYYRCINSIRRKFNFSVLDYLGTEEAKWDFLNDLANRLDRAMVQTTEYVYYKPGEFAAEVAAWARAEASKEQQRSTEKDPLIPPSSSGCKTLFDECIPLSLRTMDGVLKLAMERAFDTGDECSGCFTSATEKTYWRYTVTCVNYDSSASSVEDFLENGLAGVSYSGKANFTKLTPSPYTHISHPKPGTCLIEMTLLGTNVPVSEKESPQYDPEKEMIPVSYREDFIKS